MATKKTPPDPLDFLSGEPAPVVPGAPGGAQAADQLPQSVIDSVMALAGVDGVWIERESSGERVVVLHYTPAGPAAHLPRRVHGMRTRIVGGEPIRAQ